MSDSLTIKFWGVRGSYPVPGPSTVTVGGNTACVEVQANGHSIILDAGTGIINLGRDLIARSKAHGNPIEATLLFTHMHHDHTQGFPFFQPAYAGSSRLHIFGPDILERDLQEILAHVLVPTAFPVSLQQMSSLKEIRTIQDTMMILVGEAVGGVALRNLYHDAIEDDADLIRIHAMRSSAHPGGVLVYRLEWHGKSIVYATDVEGYVNTDQRLVAFARRSDVLIHDAQYTEEHYAGKVPGVGTTQGWGHSTASMACSVAREAEVKQLVLFHHDPQYDDETVKRIEAEARRTQPNTVSAFEGMELTL